MSEVINLRMVRKAKRRADAAKEGAANRSRYGRSNAQRANEAMDVEHVRRALDGAFLGYCGTDDTARDGE